METYALTTIDTAAIDRLQQRGLIVGIAGAVIGGLGVVLQPDQFMPSWLIGFLFTFGLTMGCFALLMLQHMTGGQWGLVTRRIFEAGARLLPLVVLLFIPVAAFAPKLYLWARPDAVRADEILRLKEPYLNITFFVIRAGVYFAVWLFCSTMLNRWSDQQDAGELAVTEADTRRFRAVSAPGLLIYVILLSLAAVDWIMSLTPHWYSTIFGLIMVVGQGLSALSFSVAVLALLVTREPMSGLLKARHFHDLGKLMLAFVMLWAYFSFSQYLIIWAGNLPAEIAWYLHRLQTGWRFLGIALILFHFAVPFVLLLSRAIKRSPDLLVKVAAGVLFARLLDLFWLIAPEFHQTGISVSWLDVVLPLSMGAIWTACFIRQLRGRAILPVHDPQFDETLGAIIERGAPPRTAH